MCEEICLATGVQNQYNDQKDWHQCVVFWFSLGVCSSCHQHPRGRTRLWSTNMTHMHISEVAFSPRSRKCGPVVLVHAKVQGVNSWCFSTNQKSCLYVHQKHICAFQTKQVLYLIVWWWPGSHFLNVNVWPSPNNDMQMLRFLFTLRKCVCVEHVKHISCLHTLHEKLKYVMPTEVWATSVFWVVKTDRGW